MGFVVLPPPILPQPADHESFCFYDGAPAPRLVQGLYLSRTCLVPVSYRGVLLPLKMAIFGRPRPRPPLALLYRRALAASGPDTGRWGNPEISTAWGAGGK